MTLSPLAGKPAPPDILVDLARLEREYYARRPDMADPTQRVSFGTSGHRGSPLHGAFTEAHILAITQAICDYRRSQGTDGPLYMGKDTHALSAQAVVGKTLVSSSMIDRVVRQLNRQLCEVPVGFKWFVSGLFDGSCCFGGEESAGASFLRHDGSVWTTDKDGPIMNLLAAEVTARTDQDPGEHYRELTAQFGTPYYTRLDAPATLAQKARLGKLSPEAVKASTLAGEPITARLTCAPGNNAPIGGLKIVTASGWFAARPSGTEHIYKIYAESFKDEQHLEAIVAEAQHIVDNALQASGPGRR